MSLPLKLDFSNYDKFLTDPNYTTSAEAQDYFRNMDMLVEALIDVGLWQPETNYPNGHIVFSPNMPNGAEAVCVATNGGESSNVEPSWGEVGGENVSDGTCFWKLRYKHWSKSVASVDDMLNGTSNDKVVTPYLAAFGQTATNRLPNATYKIDDVVYHKSNLSVAIKCTNTGTTSADELDISGVSVGDSVEDGGVLWQVVKRDLSEDLKTEQEKVQPIELGGTNATTAKQARENLQVLKREANILTNADLNNILEAGIYYVEKGSGGSSQGWTDELWGSNGFLEVYTANGSSIVKQVFRRIGTAGSNDHHTCVRQSNTSGDTWSDWKRIDNGGADYKLSAAGYYKTTEGLVFAWNWFQSSGNPKTVTKVIPFETYVAVVGDMDQNGVANPQSWDKGKTTNTTDTFYRDSNADAFVVFWVGRAV